MARGYVSPGAAMGAAMGVGVSVGGGMGVVGGGGGAPHAPSPAQCGVMGARPLSHQDHVHRSMFPAGMNLQGKVNSIGSPLPRFSFHGIDFGGRRNVVSILCTVFTRQCTSVYVYSSENRL